MENTINQRIKFVDKQVLGILAFHLVVIIFTMINNVEHGAYMYRQLSNQGELSDTQYLLISIFVIITLDLAIMLFILLGKNKVAEKFAIGMFVLNILYWDIFGTMYDIYLHISTFDPEELSKSITKFFISNLFAGAFAYSIHQFSETFKRNIDLRQHLRGIANALSHRTKEVSELIEQLSKASELKSMAIEEASKASMKLSDKEKELSEANKKASDLQEKLSVADMTIKKTFDQLSETKSNLSEAQKENKELTAQLSEHEDNKKKEVDKLTCKQCKKVFSSPQDMGKKQGGKDRTFCNAGTCPGMVRSNKEVKKLAE